MKALVYTGPKAMAYQDAVEPILGETEKLINIDSVGICGSDMHGYLGHDERRPAPLILGHEVAGTILAENNRRVCAIPLVTCQTCEYCRQNMHHLCQSRELISMVPRQGAFAERIAMPERNLVDVPDDVELWHTALVEPLSCGYHGVKEGQARLRWQLEDCDTLVIGGGAIGVAAGLSLQILGAKSLTIFEPNAERHGMLEKALNVIGTCRVLGLDDTDQIGAPELVIDAYGGEKSREMASSVVRPGGTISHIGLASATGGLDIRRMTLQEIAFVGTYTFTTQEYKDVAKLVFDGKFGDFSWVEHRDLKDGGQAFDDLLSGKVAAAKIVLHP